MKIFSHSVGLQFCPINSDLCRTKAFQFHEIAKDQPCLGKEFWVAMVVAIAPSECIQPTWLQLFYMYHAAILHYHNNPSSQGVRSKTCRMLQCISGSNEGEFGSGERNNLKSIAGFKLTALCSAPDRTVWNSLASSALQSWVIYLHINSFFIPGSILINTWINTPWHQLLDS